MKIIGISGRKKSGKNPFANYINGDILLSKKMIKDYYLDDEGKLIVHTSSEDGSEDGYGEFDVTRKDHDFVEYAHRELWPYVKVYHFADRLKEIAVGLFRLDPRLVYGTNEDKNEYTNLIWEHMPDCPPGKTGRMTVREFLEHFGTNVVRKIDYDAWSISTLNQIMQEESEVAIIPDVRFPNEVKHIQERGGKVVRLTRNVTHGTHEAETALDKENFDWNKFDVIIDNENMNFEDFQEAIRIHPFLWK